MQQYYEFITNSTGSNIELAPPVEIAKSKNNIGDVENAILDVHQKDKSESPYKSIEASPFWGLMHDCISNFGGECNGSFICGIEKNYGPINVPYHLSKMKGGVDGFDLGLFLNVPMKLFDTS